MISDELFKTALEETKTKLDELLREQETIESRHAFIDIEIAKLTNKIGHLAALAPQESPFKKRLLRAGREVGLTSVLTQVLQAASEPLTIAQIKPQLKTFGFTEESFNNFSATIHVTLDRMSKAEQVLPLKLNGRKAYKWNPDYRPLMRLKLDPKMLKEALTGKKS